MTRNRWSHIEYGYNNRLDVTDSRGKTHRGTVTLPAHLKVGPGADGKIIALEDADVVYRSDGCRFMLFGFRKGEEYALA